MKKLGTADLQTRRLRRDLVACYKISKCLDKVEKFFLETMMKNLKNRKHKTQCDIIFSLIGYLVCKITAAIKTVFDRNRIIPYAIGAFCAVVNLSYRTLKPFTVFASI